MIILREQSNLISQEGLEGLFCHIYSATQLCIVLIVYNLPCKIKYFSFVVRVPQENELLLVKTT